MDTAQEALFRTMLQSEWFTNSDGDVESPAGYFGYVWNDAADWFEVAQAFCETLDAYAPGWSVNSVPEWFVGNFTAVINSDGVIRIVKWATRNDAQRVFNHAVEMHNDWEAS